MTLKDSLYKILNYSQQDRTFELGLDAEHEIYKAHFPGRPITPGVCIVQIAQELMEELTHKKLTVISVKNAKFLSVLSPAQTPKVNYTFTKLAETEIKSGETQADGDGTEAQPGWTAQINVTYGDVTYARLTLTCAASPESEPDQKSDQETVETDQENLKTDQKTPDPLAEIRKTLHDRGICVIIPTYNNAGTVLKVIEDVLQYTSDVIVVNDGSTDGTSHILENITGITVVEYSRNRGKGYALKTGFRKALEMGFSYAITLDSDGQHFAKDIPAFLKANQEHPGCLIVGQRNLEGVDRSSGSKFANKFSNFWFFVQTGRNLKDTQTGYRLYPLRKLIGLSILPSRYEAELLLMVLASWHGVRLFSTPIDVYYPPREERVSHFRPLRDFGRISILNTILFILTIVYAIPVKCIRVIITILRNVYSMFLLTFYMMVIVTPLTWIYVKTHKMTPERKMKLHRLMYRSCRFAMVRHGIPGTKFSYNVAEGVDFDKPHVIICNHQSHLDSICQMIFTPKIIFLTNDWSWNNHLYGFLIRNAEYYPASRGLDTIMPQLQDLVARGFSIALYPEGTRSMDGEIGKFHQGAFYIADKLGLDVLPMTVYGTGMVLPKHGRWLRRAHIHIDVQAPFPQEQLARFKNDRMKAKFCRAWYKEKYAEIKNWVDKTI